MSSIDATKSVLREEIAQKISGLTTEEKRRQSKIVYDKVSKYELKLKKLIYLGFSL